MLEDAFVDLAVVVVFVSQHFAVPCSAREIHLEEYGCKERAEELTNDGLHNGKSWVSVSLARHDHVGRHGRRSGADEEEANEKPGVHCAIVVSLEPYRMKINGTY